MSNAYILFTLLLSLSSKAFSKEITDTINNLIYCFVEEKPGRSDQPAIYPATLINLF